MAKKSKASTHDKSDTEESGKTESQPSPSLAKELLELNLSEGQRHTIVKYVGLPASLFRRLSGGGTAAKAMQFTLDELDEFLDCVNDSVYVRRQECAVATRKRKGGGSL